MYTLFTDELDEGPQTRNFDSKEESIDYAVHWFVSGYTEETSGIPRGLADDVLRLVADLRADREFYCSRFGERAAIRCLTAAESR